ncbi:MAG: ABC transporter ATP-binding protein [Phycisphaerales bacterium]
MSDAIVIKGVTKTFGPKVAVDNLDMVVPRGRLCGFIGRNGAGKTTTIRMIMSIIFPDRGELTVLGKSSAVESKDRIGYLPEERGVYRKMKVLPFLTYMARLKGVDAAPARQRAMNWLERVDLAPWCLKRCEELSKGMQQKVQFVSSIIHDPELIILDEPFSGLDPVNLALLRDLIKEQHAAGKTIIFSTHVMHTAEQMCNHLFMINMGQKVLDASLNDLRERFDPRTLVVEPLVSDSSWESLRAIPGILRFTATDEGYEMNLEEHADPARIMQAALAIGPVRRVEMKRPRLEEIFRQLAGDAPDEDAQAARAPAGSGIGQD